MHIYAILISIGIIGLKLNVYFLYTKISILIVIWIYFLSFIEQN